MTPATPHSLLSDPARDGRSDGLRGRAVQTRLPRSAQAWAGTFAVGGILDADAVAADLEGWK